jgi:RNA polymerase sigma-70 factor (ECF subfamily)
MLPASDFGGNILAQQASNMTAEDSREKTSATIAFADAALVDQCRGGDLSAFASLLAKYQDRVYNAILRMCGRSGDAEELAQETFLRALQSIGQFRGDSGFYTWLFRIAVNVTISHRRKTAKVRFQPLAGPDDDYEANGRAVAPDGSPSQRDPDPETAAMSAETGTRIAAALERLDEEFRIVVVLRDIEDMDYSQIADVLQTPVGTVKSRLHRARLLLREMLSDLVG